MEAVGAHARDRVIGSGRARTAVEAGRRQLALT